MVIGNASSRNAEANASHLSMHTIQRRQVDRNVNVKSKETCVCVVCNITIDKRRDRLERPRNEIKE